jgi:hypothetical protein
MISNFLYPFKPQDKMVSLLAPLNDWLISPKK